MTVEEGRHDVTLILHRKQGTFGAVSVFCFAQNARGGAVRGEDFEFDPRVNVLILFDSFNTLGYHTQSYIKKNDISKRWINSFMIVLFCDIGQVRPFDTDLGV